MYSVIITDYRNINDTMAYIYHLYEMAKDTNIHFLVIDNSGRGDGISYLKSQKIDFSMDIILGKNIYNFYIKNIVKVVLVDANENGGYSKGNNLGARISKIIFPNDKYYIFSNSDLRFVNNFKFADMAIFVEKQRDIRIGILGPNIVDINKHRQSPRINRSFFSQMILQDFNILWFRCKFSKWLSDIDFGISEGITDWVSGSFMFVNKKAFDEVNGFDENIFLYCEEIIISNKMKDKGYVTYFYPMVLTVIHEHQGTNNKFLRSVAHNSKKYFYKNYKKVPNIFCYISDVTYFICETGYQIRRLFKKKKKI